MNKAMRVTSIPNHASIFKMYTDWPSNLIHAAEQGRSLLQSHVAQPVIDQFTLGNAVRMRIVVEVVGTPFDREDIRYSTWVDPLV